MECGSTSRRRKRKFPNVHFAIDGEQLEQVSDFRYHGHVLSEEGRCSKEIKMQIGMAKCAFNKGKELLTKGMSMNLKKKSMKTLAQSVLTYMEQKPGP